MVVLYPTSPLAKITCISIWVGSLSPDILATHFMDAEWPEIEKPLYFYRGFIRGCPPSNLDGLNTATFLAVWYRTNTKSRCPHGCNLLSSCMRICIYITLLRFGSHVKLLWFDAWRNLRSSYQVDLLRDMRNCITASRLTSLLERTFLFCGSTVALSLYLSILYCWFIRTNGFNFFIIVFLQKLCTNIRSQTSHSFKGLLDCICDYMATWIHW